MKLKTLLALLVISATMTAQDILKTELFDVDVVMKYQSQIELTSQQRETIKQIHKEHISEFNSTKWDIDANMVALNGLLVETKINETAALKQMNVVTDLENKLKMIRLEMLIKVKNELSDVQQTKLKSLRTDSDLSPTSLITSINDGQKIKLQVGKSFNPKKSPLFIIVDKNGEHQVNQKSLKDLEPQNIESVNVIKGKAAIRAYGEKGENGVILVKLKKSN